MSKSIISNRIKVISSLDHYENLQLLSDQMDLVCSIEFLHLYLHVNLLGKSNLMDAISFVLGEPTKSLRVRKLSVRTFSSFFSSTISSCSSGINPRCTD